MQSINYFLQASLYFNFYFIAINLLLTGIVYCFTQHWSKQAVLKRINVFFYIRLQIIIVLLVSTFLHFFTVYFFIIYLTKLNNYCLFSELLYIPYSKNNFNLGLFNFNIDFFGLILLLLAYVVGFLAIFVLDTRLSIKNIKYLFSFNLFIIIVYLYITTTNIILFFIYYELFLLPSFLFVYYVSPSRRAVQASVYFVVWTQIGSFIVLVAIAFIIKITGVFDYNSLRFFNFNMHEAYCIYILLFIGFGIKVPIWPFHYWLTKTHVEAPSGFSIYLSGFLVKTAIYGFYKITTMLSLQINTAVFVTFCLMGIFDGSLKMWGQTDLKKLVAYGTIQEMNLIYLVFCWGDSNLIGAGILFVATHAFLSALMFYLVDCIYRRFHTRSLIEINGILHITPNLAISIIFMVIFFAGLPGTLKFTVEFYIFSSLLTITPLLTIFTIFIANVVGLIGFSKCWFNCIFGLHKKWLKHNVIDLAYKEIYVIIICFIYLIIFTWLPLLIF